MEAAIRPVEELDSRVFLRSRFQPLRGTDLRRFLRRLDLRLRATSDALLVEHDDSCCHGYPRRWAQTVRWLDRYRLPEGPVDGQVLADIRLALGGP
ncbi:MAG: hypothetical protein M3Q65_05230 [Chloroflexota bacterium]|nr:hypothetical protein [Chloroflexota bacterium]